MRRILRSGLERLGYRITRVNRQTRRIDESLVLVGNATPLPLRFAEFGRIPGMLAPERATRLYLLAYASAIDGDVVEIGSWQGRSTCFLAQACKDSGRGVVHAIDHFRGNPGMEYRYGLDVATPADLEGRFRRNIERVGLSGYVRLHPARSAEAIHEVAGTGRPIRLLFIDGEHSYDAVRRDIELYAPLVASGGIVVFDDYSPQFPDCARAIQAYALASPAFTAPVIYEHTLVLQRR